MKISKSAGFFALTFLELAIIYFLFPMLSGAGNPLGFISILCVALTMTGAAISALMEAQVMMGEMLEKDIQSIRKRFIDGKGEEDKK